MKILFASLLLLLSLESFANTYQDFANSHFRKLDNTITVHIIPSTYPLAWTTPRALLWSIIKNQYWFPKTYHSIGHVTVEANCKINGKRLSKFMGQSTYNLDGFRAKINQGFGFSILNRPSLYSELPLVTVLGKLDKKEAMEKEFSENIQKSHFALLSYKVSEQSCLDVLGFFKEYEAQTIATKGLAPKKLRAGNVYGFGADPLTFQGAGCAPFVETTLKLAGLIGPAHMMQQYVYLDPKLTGDPEHGRRVGLVSILMNNQNMSESTNSGLKFNFPDPQNLYNRAIALGSGKTTSNLLLLDSKKIGGRDAWYILQDASNK